MAAKSVDVKTTFDASGLQSGVSQANAALGKLGAPLVNAQAQAATLQSTIAAIGAKPVVLKVDELGLRRIDAAFNRLDANLQLQMGSIGKGSHWTQIDRATQEFNRRQATVTDPQKYAENRDQFEDRLAQARAQAEAIDAILEDNRAIEEAARKRADDEQAVLDALKSLNREYDRLALTKEEILRADLSARGATQEQIAEAVRLQQATAGLADQKAKADAAARKQQANEGAVLDTVKGLQREYGRLAKTKEEMLRSDLAELGAIQAQIDQAVQLRKSTDELAKQKSLQEDINRLMVSMREEGTKRRGPTASRVDTVRARAKEVYGDDLPDDVAAQLGEADKRAVALDKRKKNLGFAMLTLGRGVQDFQAAGLMGITNNVEGLGVAMGMSAGAAGALTLGVVGLQVAMPVLKNRIGDFVEHNLPGLYDAFNTATKSVADFFDTTNRASTAHLRGEVKALSDELTRLNEKGRIFSFDKYQDAYRDYYTKSRTLNEREGIDRGFDEKATDPRTLDQRMNANAYGDRKSYLDKRFTGDTVATLGGLLTAADRKKMLEADRAQAVADERDQKDAWQGAFFAPGTRATRSTVASEAATKLRDQIITENKALVEKALEGDVESLKKLQARVEADATLPQAEKDRIVKGIKGALDPLGMLHENDRIAREQNAPHATFNGENRVREMREEADILDSLIAKGTKLKDIEFEKAIATEKSRMAYQHVNQAVIDQIEAETRRARTRGLDLQGKGKAESLREEVEFTKSLISSGINLNSIAERRAQIEKEYRDNVKQGMSERQAEEIRTVQLERDRIERARKFNDEIARGRIALANPGLTGPMAELNRQLQMGEKTPEQIAALRAQAKGQQYNDKRVGKVDDAFTYAQGAVESTRTVDERRRDDLERLSLASELGMVDEKTKNRQLSRMAMGEVATGDIGAVEAGSVEAASMMARRDNESSQYLSRIADIGNESRKIQAESRDKLDVLIRINNNRIDGGGEKTAGSPYKNVW